MFHCETKICACVAWLLAWKISLDGFFHREERSRKLSPPSLPNTTQEIGKITAHASGNTMDLNLTASCVINPQSTKGTGYAPGRSKFESAAPTISVPTICVDDRCVCRCSAEPKYVNSIAYLRYHDGMPKYEQLPPRLTHTVVLRETVGI